MTHGIDKQAEILLAKAAEDETAASLTAMPDGPFGFHVQQAVEKLLKALCCQLAIPYRFTHDLESLAELLKEHGEALPNCTVDFAELENFGVAYRYGSIPEIATLDRTAGIETVRILREHITARIAALSSQS
jgi:HEPN domain-containing protein